jgi:hypothetical protein
MGFELLLGLLLLLALPLWVIGVAASIARKCVNQVLRLELADPDAIPADIAEALLPARSALAALDFELLNHVAIHASAVDHPPAWGLTWCDQTTSHYACVSAIQPFHQSGLILCDFVTVLDDDRHLITTNAKNYHHIRPYPGEIRQYAVGVSIPQLWQLHQQRLAQITASPLALSLSEFNDRLHQHSLNRVRHAVKQGAIQWVIPDQTFRYTWLTAIGFTTRVAIGMFGKSPQIRLQSAAAQQIQVQQEVKTFLENRTPKPILSKQNRSW